MTTSVEYEVVYALQNDYLRMYMMLHQRLFETQIADAPHDEIQNP